MESDVTKLTLPKAMYDRIEEDVVKLHIGLKLKLPVDPFIVAKRLGFVVRRFSEIADSEVLEILETAPDKSRDGLSYYDPKLGTYVIWINDLHTTYVPRLNFTIMHEVGHIRLGHRTDSPLAEVMANYYAAYALVPSPLPSMLKCNSFMEIAIEFDVSTDCAFICSARCIKWAAYGGGCKPYEESLIDYYKSLTSIGGR